MNTIQILGVSDYSKTLDLKINAHKALNNLGLRVNWEEITDIETLLDFHLTGIPALAIDGKIIYQKSLPTVENLEFLFHIFATEKSQADQINHILIPTDFSPISREAYQYAHCLAAHFSASLELLNVHFPNALETTPFYINYATPEIEQKKEALLSFAKATALPPSCCGEERVEIKEHFSVACGLPEDVIVKKSQNEAVDLIVMSTTGENNWYQKWLGSISRHTAINAQCPVLLIPKGITYRCPRHILYATNYHPNEFQAIEQLIAFAKYFKSQIHIVHIATTETADLAHEKNISSQPFRNGLPNLYYKISTIVEQDVLTGLNRYATENNIDLIAMPTVNRPFFTQLFHKSTTKEMAIQTKIPLLVLHI